MSNTLLASSLNHSSRMASWAFALPSISFRPTGRATQAKYGSESVADFSRRVCGAWNRLEKNDGGSEVPTEAAAGCPEALPGGVSPARGMRGASALDAALQDGAGDAQTLASASTASANHSVRFGILSRSSMSPPRRPEYPRWPPSTSVAWSPFNRRPTVATRSLRISWATGPGTGSEATFCGEGQGATGCDTSLDMRKPRSMMAALWCGGNISAWLWTKATILASSAWWISPLSIYSAV